MYSEGKRIFGLIIGIQVNHNSECAQYYLYRNISYASPFLFCCADIFCGCGLLYKSCTDEGIIVLNKYLFSI